MQTQIPGTPENIRQLAISIAKKYGVDPALVLAHIKVESDFDPMAYRREAALADASWGLMQVLLKTAKEITGNSSLTATELIKPEINIDAGVRYIKKNLTRYRGNLKDAIATYNAGSARKNSAGQYVNTQGKTIVQNYVDKVYMWYLYYRAYTGIAAPKLSLVVASIAIGGILYISARK